MADVTVDATVNVFIPTFSTRLGPVWTTTDIGYVVYSDNNFDLVYQKTIDGGANWGAPVMIDVTGVGSMDIWFDKWTPGNSGTTIHIWWTEWSTHAVHYRDLDTSSDALGTDVTVFSGVSFGSSASRDNHAISGTKAVGGNLYVQFWADPNGERGFYRSVTAGAAWAGRTDGADGDLVDEVLCLPDDDSADNQDIVMLYWDRSANEITIKKYDDSGNSWGETVVSGSMNDTVTTMQMSAVVRHSDGHIIVAAWTDLDLATADLKVWDITLATPTITAKTDVVTDSDDCACVALFIDQNTDDLYCAYLGNEDGSETWGTTVTAFYKKSGDGGANWDAQAAYQEGAADNEKYLTAGHSTPGSAAGRFEPMFFNEDLDDLLVNKVNSVELAAIVTALASQRLKIGHGR